MCIRWIAVIFLFLPAGLLSQNILTDTFAVTDTIPRTASSLKNAGELTFETRVDSALTLVINELLASNSGSLPDNYGDDDDWFEIYNYGDDPVPLDSLFFTDDPAEPFKWKLDSIMALDPGEHLLIWADGEPEEGYNHSSFSLSSEGEYLAIYSEDGTPIDQIYYGSQSTDISFGRYPDAGLSWNYFTVPTPGEANADPGAAAILPAPSSNLSGGFYTSPVIMALYANATGARIYYTTDCTVPDSTDLLYRAPVEISSTSIIRARVIKEGSMDSPVLTISILMEDFSFENPVVSLVAEPEALFGNAGIISANNSAVEVSAHMEYMEKGNTTFRGGTGLQLHAPRQAKPFSLRLLSRTRYGNSWFDYPFFKEEGPDRFKRLILRNSGNDNVNKAVTNTHFRDPLIHDLAKISNRDPLISESLPVNVFLNGSYHGLFNLREREDRYYIESHTGVTENYDFIELEFGYYANLHIIEGSYDNWRELLSFVDTTGDLSQDADYNIVQELADLDNFTDYWISEVFVGNYDWLSNNVKFWKPHNGKWQWLYWDTDHGLGLVYASYGNADWNTLNWSLTFSDRAWANGYHNILIRNLLKNEGYKEHFIKRFTVLLNTSFSYPETSLLLDSMKSLYENDMAIHTAHWDRSMSNWTSAIQRVDDYLQSRPDHVFGHIRDFFGLQEPVPVSIRVEPPGAGTISLSGLDISREPMAGKLFPGMSYHLQSKAIPGFSLDRWTPFQSSEDSITFQLTDSMDVVAFFLPSDHSFPIQLCEVYVNNRSAYDAGDWIEFYYYGSDSLQMGGWQITGDNGQELFTFNEEVVLYPGQRFVVCEDRTRFEDVFPVPMHCFGDINKSISNHSTLSLRSADGELKKSVNLMSSGDWPALPQEGFSLELKHLTDETDLGSSWELSEDIFGTPGLANHHSHNFQPPRGKDTVLNNHETHILAMSSSTDYYQDPDAHQLAAISIIGLTGPGVLYHGETIVEQGKTYMPSDLVFSPQEPFTSSSSLTYSFIDKSGQESSSHEIQFNPSTRSKENIRDIFSLYPIPAKDHCIIVMPPEHQGPVEFNLFDLNGRKLQSRQLSSSGDKIHVDLSDVGSGMYFFLIRTRQAVVNGKLEVIK